MAYTEILSENRSARISEVHAALIRQGYLALLNHPDATGLAEKIADLRGLVGVEIDLDEGLLIIHTDGHFCPYDLALPNHILPESEARTRTELWWAAPDLSQKKPQAGKQYLRLYHGRKDLKENLEDWGSEGPVFGPYESIQVTYRCHIKMHTGSGFDDLHWHEDLIYYDGIFYGDMEIFSAEEAQKTMSYTEEKSKQPNEIIKENNDESKPAL
jgi:hypothetical protein